MLVTLDGKIASGTSDDIFGPYYEVYDQLQDELGATSFLCGRVTMEMFVSQDNPPVADSVTSYAFAVDTQGKLQWQSNSIISALGRNQQFKLVVLVTSQTPASYLDSLTSLAIPYLVCGDTSLDWHIALSQIAEKYHIDKLLVEGGGVVNGSLLAAGLIDELSLVVCPIAVNSSQAPSLFESLEIFPFAAFQLLESRPLANSTLWLRYSRL